MIRPIHTQIVHPQTPEIASRQQKSNNVPAEQQTQVGELVKKDVQRKKDTVVQAQDPDHLRADQDTSRQPGTYNKQGSKKRKKDKEASKDETQKNSRIKIDIRI